MYAVAPWPSLCGARPLEEGENVIGRQKRWPVRDRRVSREHLVVRVHDHRITAAAIGRKALYVQRGLGKGRDKLVQVSPAVGDEEDGDDAPPAIVELCAGDVVYLALGGAALQITKLAGDIEGEDGGKRRRHSSQGDVTPSAKRARVEAPCDDPPLSQLIFGNADEDPAAACPMPPPSPPVSELRNVLAEIESDLGLGMDSQMGLALHTQAPRAPLMKLTSASRLSARPSRSDMDRPETEVGLCRPPAPYEMESQRVTYDH
eukprot:TRINITY_DN5551_c0_g2_i1.p1 TRINITY_DN5551_c0_g2~~TRINITY_DN5551_c0_g2_i1.p1  ORF type:complete len:261 (+),score=64.76 TRINITY_DN5551_c0_g2_i1:46-828(+)